MEMGYLGRSAKCSRMDRIRSDETKGMSYEKKMREEMTSATWIFSA
jgi:hypothetical protein